MEARTRAKIADIADSDGNGVNTPNEVDMMESSSLMADAGASLDKQILAARGPDTNSNGTQDGIGLRLAKLNSRGLLVGGTITDSTRTITTTKVRGQVIEEITCDIASNIKV